jgi:hypothetical protein
MTASRFATLVGLALGAVWALDDFGGLLQAAIATAVGYVVGLVLEGRIDIDTGGLTVGSRRDSDSR